MRRGSAVCAAFFLAALAGPGLAASVPFTYKILGTGTGLGAGGTVTRHAFYNESNCVGDTNMIWRTVFSGCNV